MADQVELYIEHVVNIHNNPQSKLEPYEENTDKDSGRWSSEMLNEHLPGAQLSEEEFTKEFAHKNQLDTISIRSYMEPGVTYLRDYDSYPSLYDSYDSFDSRNISFPPPPPKKLEEKKECIICTGDIAYDTDLVYLETCCKQNLCTDCMTSMIKIRVMEGQTFMPCPNPSCSKAFQRDMVVKYIREDEEILMKYERFRLNVEGDGKHKTCPNCCLITEVDLAPFKPRNKKVLTPEQYCITCEECDFKWCFNCHSPWHEGLSCHTYRMGDKQFQKWTKGRKSGYVPNCQRCPKCRVFIERSSGCDNMYCTRCKTYFCYQCGERKYSFALIGDHYSKASVLGCPYNYLPEQNAKRRFIRGSFLFTKCAALTAYPVLLVGGVVIIAVGAAVVLPTVGTYLAVKKLKQRYR